MASLSAGNTATSCVVGPLRAGGVRRDPELGVFGSQEKRRRIIAGESQKNRIVAILGLLHLSKQIS
ncbi:hypothetical protein [Klebsiella pneumoniae]|uniref:hypothetical protein n=1 Tax=Klebsiella pneumoniae TaxID=573 RepID=UPI0034CDF6A9